MKTHLLYSIPAHFRHDELLEPHPLLKHFKKAMIAEASFVASQWKIFFGMASIAILAVADAATTSPWEDWSLKGLLLGAVIFVVRLLLLEQAKREKAEQDHKSEIKELMSTHAKTLETALESNTDSNDRVTAAMDESLKFYRDMTKAAVEERFARRTP